MDRKVLQKGLIPAHPAEWSEWKAVPRLRDQSGVIGAGLPSLALNVRLRMSFRQANKDSETMWRKRRREELLAAGVPDFLIDDERRWTYVPLHGDDELESGWTPAWITKPQAVDLLRMLKRQYDKRVGLDLFTALEKRIND